MSDVLAQVISLSVAHGEAGYQSMNIGGVSKSLATDRTPFMPVDVIAQQLQLGLRLNGVQTVLPGIVASRVHLHVGL